VTPAARPRNREALAAALASLPGLDLDALKAHWRALYRSEPPPRMRRALLMRAVAYRLQEEALGGLRPATRRLLQRVAAETRAGRSAMAPSTLLLRPGTRLLREWQGVTHEVIVLESGVLFRGERYRSLSEVARAITSSRWSGPRFFGLNAMAERPSGES